MKTVIEKSIAIYGMGHPDVKTIFNLNTIPSLKKNATEEQKVEVAKLEEENKKVLNDIRFKSLTTISGRTLTAWFDYMDGEEKKSSSIPMKIIKSTSEDEIKAFILDQINEKLK